jgi:hypothetical protein
MVSVAGIKEYLTAKGFKIDGIKFVKEYPLPLVEGEDAKTIKIKYVIERPWVKGFRIDSIGREVLFSKGKLKNISIDENGNMIGFLIKQNNGGNIEWTSN